MAEYAYQKKDAQEVRTPKVQQADPVRFHSVPNSLFVGQGDRTDSNLGAVMRERVAALQRQIPSAEREADRLSQGITATTPEGVRQQMGQRLGADFSNVRMYTDQSAANKADRMGAKAYTAGQNVYFGSGGFVPQVAAHELVHTVQQGAVEGVGVQQSVSFGTVQMCPLTEEGVNVPVEKFRDYIFKDGATHGKDVVFKSLGYKKEDSQILVDLYRKQAMEKYNEGKYTLGKRDDWGQRINIEIILPGTGEYSDKVSYLQSGWMIKSDGTISLNTPFAGFTRDKE